MQAMYDDYEIPKRRLSEEDVLAMLAEEHRHRERICPESSGVELISFDTTVAEYEKTFDVMRRIPTLARDLNRFLGMNIERELCDAMRPPKKRTLRDICRVVAANNIEREAVVPVQVLGSNCATAGAFVTLRTLLNQAGADVSEVAPSTPLAEYTRQYPRVFFDLGLMAPGRLPLAHAKYGLIGFLSPVFAVSWIATIAGLCLWSAPVFGWAWGITVFTWILAWLLRDCGPKELRFGELRTFRDLSVAVAR